MNLLARLATKPNPLKHIKRCPNFSAGPGKLPDEVILRLMDEMFDYEGRGVSIIEVSHRSAIFQRVYEETQTLMRRVFQIPQDYQVLYMHGGATMQFALLPLNFLKTKAGYADTGMWAAKAISEARMVGPVEVVTSSEKTGYNYIPKIELGRLPKELDYLHITTNNTIYGSQYHSIPDTGDLPLFADASSDIGCRPLDVKKFKVIYGADQKNLGVAGISFVIMHESMLAKERKDICHIFQYSNFAQHDSMPNTPNTFGIFVLKLMLEYYENRGGLAEIGRENEKKAALLYSVLDAHPEFYRSKIARVDRSIMNVSFFLKDKLAEETFTQEAEKHQLYFLKGHKASGGLRASIYNATRLKDVELLVQFMHEYYKSNA